MPLVIFHEILDRFLRTRIAMVRLSHLLKWEHQPPRRSASWRGTIREQRRELRQLLDSGTLRQHAQAVLADAYAESRKQAADETELPLAVFPIQNRVGLEELLVESDADGPIE